MTLKSNNRILLAGVSSFVLSLAALNPMSAIAQEATNTSEQGKDTKQSEKPAEGGEKKDVVVVTGTTAATQNKIDRQVYDIKDNIAAQTGSGADALNQVPSVNVDSDGNITLRGQSNVKVLVNGRDSAMMKGDNRAASILSMAGGDIDSIEVMNNPGAAFSSEGTGGIINIVMRKNRKPGKNVMIMANAGTEGRFNTNVNGSYSTDKFSLTGGLNYRNDVRKNYSETERTLKTNSTTQDAYSLLIGEGDTTRTSYSANLGLEYFVTPDDTFTMQGNFSNRQSEPGSKRTYTGYDANGILKQSYIVDSIGDGEDRDDWGLAIGWDHNNAKTGARLKSDLRYSQSKGTTDNDTYYQYTLPNVNKYHELQTSASDLKNYIWSLDYELPVGDAKITTGLQSEVSDNETSNIGFTLNEATGLAVPNPNKTNSFESYQVVNAGYFTYQDFLTENIGAQIGVRVENTSVDTRNPLSGYVSSSNYTNVSPSAFAYYTLPNNNRVRLSYSRRIQRPSVNDLDSTPFYQDAENVRVGNPNLKPQTTDSLELGYEASGGIANYQIRAFYKYNDDIITSYSEYISDNVLKTTKINSGTGQSAGLEGNLDKKFFDKKLSVNINGTVSYVEMDAVNSSKTTISGTTYSARIRTSYDITPKDKVQLMIGGRGREYTAQGYNGARMMSMVSYSHQFTPMLTFTANMTNPFDIEKSKSVTESDVFYSKSTRDTEAQVFYLGLRMILGATPKSDNQGDFPRPPRGPGMGGGPMM